MLKLQPFRKTENCAITPFLKKAKIKFCVKLENEKNSLTYTNY